MLFDPVLIVHFVNVPQSPARSAFGQTPAFPSYPCAKADCRSQQSELENPPDGSIAAPWKAAQRAKACSNGGGRQSFSDRLVEKRSKRFALKKLFAA
jgi:hypothetical protein